MKIELINTGTELMAGRVLNGHQQWICSRLTGLGFPVDRQVAVPDNGPAIQDAVRDALGRADAVIVTGGLGPTSDDVTRDCISSLLGKPLRQDADVLAGLEGFYAARKRVMSPSARVQAMVPEGSVVLPNLVGTAPGLAIEVSPNPWRTDRQSTLVVLLPGPPRELYPMFEQQVIPLLRQKSPSGPLYESRTIKTTGLPESAVEEKIAGPLADLVGSGLELGYCARIGEVEVHLAVRGKEKSGILAQAERIVRASLEPHIFGVDDERLEAVVVSLLTRKHKTLALAESCTGGYLAHRITNVPGASDVLVAGLVTYSNAAKQFWLDVPAEIIATHGAVSEATA
ncbi:MAG: CinA family nicotinamide mononucleotide deamidase-related protein, partial [Candidatus Omnitrophica bacterium]|nr:CinA family nicotinamide mononucleotide deamidase-related protein [Candidatus Omnitrophota bacterium]